MAIEEAAISTKGLFGRGHLSGAGEGLSSEVADMMNASALSLRGKQPSVGPANEGPSFLEAAVGAVFDRKPEDAIFEQPQEPEDIVTQDDIQTQFDNIKDMSDWKPAQKISQNQATSLNVSDAKNKEAERVETADQKLEQVDSVEQDIEQYIQQIEEGKSAMPEPEADSAPGGGMRLTGSFAANAGITAAAGALGGPKAAFMAGLAMTGSDILKTARAVIDNSNSHDVVARQGAGTGTEAAARSSSQGQYLSKTEMRDGGYRPAASAPQQGAMTAGASPGYNRAVDARAADQFGKIPTGDVIFGVNNASCSLQGISRCEIEQDPTIMAWRERIRDMREEFGLQKETGQDTGQEYARRLEKGVDLAKVDNIGAVGTKAREEFARTGSTISFSA